MNPWERRRLRARARVVELEGAHVAPASGPSYGRSNPARSPISLSRGPLGRSTDARHAQPMPPFSRGFRGRRVDVDAARVPPGQYVTRDFPVLSAGPTPHTPLDQWSFTINGSADDAVSWPWEEFIALPRETVTADIHCVTKWSKLDTTWTGVSVDTLLEGVDTDAGYVTAWCDGGYTTNLPLEDLTGGRAGIAYEYGGEPLEPQHGGASGSGPAAGGGFPRSGGGSRSSLSTAARRGCWSRTCTSGRARSGSAASSCATTTNRASGRPTATTTTAIPGKSSAIGGTDRDAGPDRMATRRRQRRDRRDAPREDAGARRARLARTRGRPARRRPSHRRGRLPGTALVLDRLGAGGHDARADGRTTRGRRGLAVSDRRARSR